MSYIFLRIYIDLKDRESPPISFFQRTDVHVVNGSGKMLGGSSLCFAQSLIPQGLSIDFLRWLTFHHSTSLKETILDTSPYPSALNIRVGETLEEKRSQRKEARKMAAVVNLVIASLPVLVFFAALCFTCYRMGGQRGQEEGWVLAAQELPVASGIPMPPEPALGCPLPAPPPQYFPSPYPHDPNPTYMKPKHGTSNQ